MSRIGKMPIEIPKGVEIKFENNIVSVKGPKGSLQQEIKGNINIKVEDEKVIVERPDDQKQSKSYHGLYRSLVNSMIIGVSTGFKKILDINGVGYKAEKKGESDLVLSLGYSHQIDFKMPEGITFDVDKPGRQITIEGIDKQVVGQVSAIIRGYRGPEPYKGKGIKYSDEVIIRKEGKTK